VSFLLWVPCGGSGLIDVFNTGNDLDSKAALLNRKDLSSFKIEGSFHFTAEFLKNTSSQAR